MRRLIHAVGWVWNDRLVDRFVRQWVAADAGRHVMAIAYCLLLSLAPLLLAVISGAGFALGGGDTRARVAAAVAAGFPRDLATEALRTLEGLRTSAQSLGLFSLVGLAWTMNALASTLQAALNRAWGVPNRSVLRANAIGLALVPAGAAVVSLILAAGAASIIVSRSAFGGAIGWEIRRFDPRWIAIEAGGALALAAVLVMLYWRLPNARVPARAALAGGLLAAVLLVTAFQVFPIYLAVSGAFDKAGAALGMLLIVLGYLHVLAQAIMAGAVLSAVVGSTAGEPPQISADI